jgi:hypothetical protein
VTLSNGNDVREVIACAGSKTAWPAAPCHARPSGKTTAADAPGMPVSATFSRKRASSARETCAVSRGSDTDCCGRGVPLPQPAMTKPTSTTQATLSRATGRHYALR